MSRGRLLVFIQMGFAGHRDSLPRLFRRSAQWCEYSPVFLSNKVRGGMEPAFGFSRMHFMMPRKPIPPLPRCASRNREAGQMVPYRRMAGILCRDRTGNAVRCIGHHSVLHQSSQYGASAIAARCVFEGGMEHISAHTSFPEQEGRCLERSKAQNSTSKPAIKVALGMGKPAFIS